MMTSTGCAEKAEMCDARAIASVDTPLAAEWREMAIHWRALADDEAPQGTLARLMSTRRSSRG
jgi:hypothetical protein